MNTPTRPSRPIRLYRMLVSGHCHRVELFLRMLDLPYEVVEIDLRKGETRTAAFLALNAFGQVPVIQDGDVTLADSNAILVYLEKRYAPGRWMPQDALGAAAVQRWFSVAAGDMDFGPATARVIHLFQRPDDPSAAQQRALRLFQVMEQELAQRPFLAGTQATLADIALYTYTVLAPEGGVSLLPFAQLRAWLARVEALPGFMPMVRTPVGLEA